MATNPEKKLYSFEQYVTLLHNSTQRLEYDHEVITRTETGWQYAEYGYDEQFTLTSLDITIRVADIYRRLSIPLVKRSSLPIEVVETTPAPENE